MYDRTRFVFHKIKPYIKIIQSISKQFLIIFFYLIHYITSDDLFDDAVLKEHVIFFLKSFPLTDVNTIMIILNLLLTAGSE